MIVVPNDNVPNGISLHDVVQGIAAVAATPALRPDQAFISARTPVMALLGRDLTQTEIEDLDDVLWACRFTTDDWPRHRDALFQLTRFITKAQRQAAA